MTDVPHHCNKEAIRDYRHVWRCQVCGAWKWVKPRDEENRWRVPITKSRYDWNLIVIRVKKATGLTDESIAGERGLEESTVRKWRNEGRCPRYDDGEWLAEKYVATFGPLPLVRL